MIKLKPDFDICIIGGGIVGLATALALARKKRPLKIAVIEKEQEVAQHQTGHNSGVIHSGIYYEPDSLKANLCRQGCSAIKLFAEEHNIPFDTCGKLIVATDKRELERLEALHKRASDNQIDACWLGQSQLKQTEPNVNGLAALLIKSTGIIDYAQVCRAIVEYLKQHGVVFMFNNQVHSITTYETYVDIGSKNSSLTAKYLIACAGLHADRLAIMAGLEPELRIIPFRGEYFLLPKKYNNLFNHLIYPVPDPDLPFLGVHFTRKVNGSVTVGPNAVLGLHREGYKGVFPFNYKDAVSALTYPGTWRLLARHWRASLDELKDTLIKTGYLNKCRKFYGALDVSDLMSYPPGIRAQAVRLNGTAEQDFVFLDALRMTHVLNAPSPAATSSIPIGEKIAERALQNLKI